MKRCREGYEFAVSRPKVIMHEENGKLLEPMQRVTVNVVDHYAGRVIQAFNLRKGIMEDMDSTNVEHAPKTPKKGKFNSRKPKLQMAIQNLFMFCQPVR